ncbi:hypothetical protein Tsubulata_017587 [Turnera subulata]|uniref:DUF4219 domain-containing protein n=1 Tax=Turnera subulata TaxID=218843 RepID=A0A9Q0G660_9ROSI|nr:hypothetical protein Tsubulata_017587 [Turnera subulata]
MATTTHIVPNAVMVLKDLEADTYENWKACMMAYMEAQDLWDVMDEPAYPDARAYQNKFWRKKNAAALLAIKASCAPEILSHIRDTRSAKLAWDTLAAQSKQLELPNQQELPSQPQMPEFSANEHYGQYWMEYSTWTGMNTIALRAIQDACSPYIPSQIAGATSAKIVWETLAKLDQFKQRGIPRTDQRYNNPLLDVNAGYISGTTNPPTWIYQPNLGTSLLSYETKNFGLVISAIKNGEWGAILSFIERDPRILTSIISQDGSIPIHQAATAHQTEIARRLVELMSEQDLEIQSSNGHTALHDAAHVGSTAIARFLVQKNKKLVQIQSVIGAIPVALASASGYKDTTRYLYNCTPIELLYPENGNNGFGLLQYCITNRMFGLKQIYEMKLNHIYAMECIACICKEIPTTDLSQFSENTLWLTLLAAVQNGIEEIVIEILKAHPDSIIAVDNKGRDLMMLAIAFRQEKIFNLMLEGRRYTKADITDYNGNNMLHWAGMSPPPQQLARISGSGEHCTTKFLGISQQ